MAKKARARSAAVAIDLDNLMPLPEAAELAGVTEQWMRRLVNSGRVRGVRIGRNYLVDRSAAAEFERHPYLGRPRGGS